MLAFAEEFPGGGTSFEPPFAWLAESGLQPDVVIYFTDADGTFPAAEPPWPVLDPSGALLAVYEPVGGGRAKPTVVLPS